MVSQVHRIVIDGGNVIELMNGMDIDKNIREENI
jgi:hypothetical protein